MGIESGAGQDSARKEEIARVRRMVERLDSLGLGVIPVHHPWEEVPAWAKGTWVEGKHRGKRPMVAFGRFREHRPPRALLRRWFWSGWEVNVAVLTGRVSGLVVVDVDSDTARAWALKNLPPTPMVTLTSMRGTERGEHWYYRIPARSGQVPNRCKIYLEGREVIAVDLRGEGGTAVAPGSRHRTGLIYEEREAWTSRLLDAVPELDPSALPRRKAVGLVLASDGGAEARARAERWMEKRGPAIAGQGGDAFTYATASFLVGNFRLSDRHAWELLVRWNLRNEPPWTEGELLEKLMNAKRYCQRASD